jgi:sugar lactone lactonase YvrE
MNNHTPNYRSAGVRIVSESIAVALAIALSSRVGLAAEPPPADARSAELAACEEILRHAGASPAVLTSFEGDMQRATPAEISSWEKYLHGQSPAELGKTIERMQWDAQYVIGPDSMPQPGVPKGKVFEFAFDHSRIFPDTTRKISVYVPAEYRGDRPACVFVCLDGMRFEAPIVFDNLIYKHEMPVTIAIGITAGEAPSAVPSENPRFNRSFEFDGLNDNLSRFLLDEVLPEVERHQTPDGLPIRLSHDPNDRATGGGSTGGIGAFTLAWEHPDAFRRVYIKNGTFVGIRGGDRYPVLVRKTDPKPIRIFMQDGSHDGLDGWLGEVGDWWMSNQALQRALEFSGYQVAHVWGEGPHGSRQGTVVFPDAMRYLWKDWPQAITPGESQNAILTKILLPGEGWQAVPGDYRCNGILAPDNDGVIAFCDPAAGKTWKIAADGRLSDYSLIHTPYSGLAFGPDGRVFVSDAANRKIVSLAVNGDSTVVAKDIKGSKLVVTDRGYIYTVESQAGRIWLLKPNGEKLELDSGLNHPSGIARSPDGLWLAVAEKATHWGYSYRVEPDGTVRDKQRFYWFHVPDTADDSGAGAWVMDREGLLYAATRMGVQVFDRNGRSRAILPVPGGEVTGIAFGGAHFDTLYVSCADHKLYRRKLKVPGAPAWMAPIELPAASAG